jgi:hypothetical protein
MTPDNGRTTIRYERNGLMSAAHLTSDDGGCAYVFCALPGGRPWFALRADGPATTITNAPQCETHRDFVRFVTTRFGS